MLTGTSNGASFDATNINETWNALDRLSLLCEYRIIARVIRCYRRRLMQALLAASMVIVPSGAFAQDVLIVGGRIFDSISDELRSNSAILILDGEFARLDTNPQNVNFEGIPVVELSENDTILPGFFDLHAHYNIEVGGQSRTDDTKHYSIIYLANGSTSTYTAGEYDPDEMLAMRKRIESGEQIGPRVFTSGPYFGQSMEKRVTAAEVVELVDEWFSNGVRSFKAKGTNETQLQALIERAHAHGATVTGHLDSGYRDSVNPRDAILMGIDRVEHFLGGDLLPDSRPAHASLAGLTDADIASPAMDEIIDLFIEHGVYFDATLAAYGYLGHRDEVYDRWHDESKYFTPYVREWTAAERRQINELADEIYHVKHKTLQRFYSAGGLITTGTDHVSTGEYLGGFAIHRELHALVRAGVAPADALKMATINGARALNVSDELGSIEVGKLADLVVIKGDPLKDITNTRTVHTVIKGGIAYDSSELLRSVEGTLGPHEPVTDYPRLAAISAFAIALLTLVLWLASKTRSRRSPSGF